MFLKVPMTKELNFYQFCNILSLGHLIMKPSLNFYHTIMRHQKSFHPNYGIKYTVKNIPARTNLLVRLSNDFKDRINVCRFDLFSFFKVRMTVDDFQGGFSLAQNIVFCWTCDGNFLGSA